MTRNTADDTTAEGAQGAPAGVREPHPAAPWWDHHSYWEACARDARRWDREWWTPHIVGAGLRSDAFAMASVLIFGGAPYEGNDPDHVHYRDRIAATARTLGRGLQPRPRAHQAGPAGLTLLGAHVAARVVIARLAAVSDVGLIEAERLRAALWPSATVARAPSATQTLALDLVRTTRTFGVRGVRGLRELVALGTADSDVYPAAVHHLLRFLVTPGAGDRDECRDALAAVMADGSTDPTKPTTPPTRTPTTDPPATTDPEGWPS